MAGGRDTAALTLARGVEFGAHAGHLVVVLGAEGVVGFLELGEGGADEVEFGYLC